MPDTMFRDTPWMVSAGRLDPDTRKARLASVFFEPGDADLSRPFDIEDYVHVETGFDASAAAPAGLLLKAALASGTYAAKLLGEDEVRIWPELCADAGGLPELAADNDGGARTVPSEPDAGLKAEMAYLRDGLEAYLALRPGKQSGKNTEGGDLENADA